MSFPPLVPNPKSRHKTPASVQFELHYAKLGIIARWDWQRYCRLAAFLQLTPFELASLICWTHWGVKEAEKRNRFPSAVCLLLTLLEAQLMARFTDDVIAKPFPETG